MTIQPQDRSLSPAARVLPKRHREILRRLRRRGQLGITRLEVPPHLAWSLPQRIAELRRAGHRIEARRDPQTRVARYVIVQEQQSTA